MKRYNLHFIEKIMLAIFDKEFAHPPEELSSPASKSCSSTPQQTLNHFIHSNSNSNSSSMSFADAAVLAYVTPNHHSSQHHRLFCGYDEIYCLFMGRLNNLCAQIKQYGLSRNSNEAMVAIEAYRTLRDPADQLIKDLDGSFAFLLFDCKLQTVFIALGSDGRVKLYWGIAGDGSVVISDDLELVKTACANSFAPFPTGCIFHSEAGVTSFEHPMNKVRAMPRVDSEGVICGANFKVDLYSRVNSIPRVGSETNWVHWTAQHPN